MYGQWLKITHEYVLWAQGNIGNWLRAGDKVEVIGNNSDGVYARKGAIYTHIPNRFVKPMIIKDNSNAYQK